MLYIVLYLIWIPFQKQINKTHGKQSIIQISNSSTTENRYDYYSSTPVIFLLCSHFHAGYNHRVVFNLGEQYSYFPAK